MNKIKFIFLFLITFSSFTFAQTQLETLIPVELRVKGVGNTPIEVIAIDTNIYLPVIEVLNFMGIWNSYSEADSTITGFYKEPKTKYTINFASLKAKLNKKVFQMSPTDYLISQGKLYFKMDFINQFFNLGFKYKPRQLMIEEKLVPDLPKVKYYSNIKRREQQTKHRITMPSPDIEYGHSFSVFDGGRFGWNLSNRFSKYTYPYRHYSLIYGGGLLGGDLNLRYFGVKRKYRPYSEFRGQWRYPLVDETFIRQIIIGDIVTEGFSSRLIRGLEISNKPLQQRYLFGYEDFEGRFTPDVDVQFKNTQGDLEYTRSDSLGRYFFHVPIYYGQGRIDLQSFDPWGFQESEKYRINLPFSIVPPGTVEYSLKFGRHRHIKKSYASAFNLQWGVTTNLTIGAAIDYIDLPKANNKFYPTLTSMARLGHGIILDISSTPFAYSNSSLRWLFGTDGELNLSSTYYAKNNYFNPVNMKSRFDISTRIPFFQGTGIQFVGSQTNHDKHYYRNSEISLYAYSRYFSPRFTSRWYWRYNDSKTSLLNRMSILDLSFTLPLGIFVYFEGSYDHLNKRTESIGLNVNKIIFKSLRLSFSHYKLPSFGTSITSLNLEYLFPFLRANAGVSQRSPSYREYTLGGSGAIDFSVRPTFLYFENNLSNKGYGGIRLNPYFDSNNNGMQDPEEEVIKDAKVYFSNYTRNSGVSSMSINSFRLMKLPVYEQYDIGLDQNTLENPMLVSTSEVFRVYAEPDRIRTIDVPLVIGGTIQGTIKFRDQVLIAEGIKIKLKNRAKSGGKIYSTTSFSTGEYEFAAIPPGKYRIELDSDQLNTLGLKAQPTYYDVEIHTTAEGEIVAGKDFTLVRK